MAILMFFCYVDKYSLFKKKNKIKRPIANEILLYCVYYLCVVLFSFSVLLTSICRWAGTA